MSVNWLHPSIRDSFLIMTFLALLLASQSGSAQGVTHEHVAGNVWRIDGAIDVITVQTGPDGLLMVDTGYPFAEEGVRSALREIAGTDRPTKLINTHVHHGFSNHLYGDGAEIIAHERAGQRMESGFLMAGAVVGSFDDAALPDVFFTDSMRFRMNGEDLSLIHLPGAHTDTDAIVVFHGSNVVLTGDIVVPHMPWVSLDEDADAQHLMRALDRLTEIIPDDAKIVPGHDRVTLDKDDLRAFKNMIEGAVDTVRARMNAGMNLRQIQSIGLPHLEDWTGAVPEDLFIESLYRSLVEPRRSPDAPTIEFTGGLWWEGAGFVRKTMYSLAGVLTSDRPAAVERTLDLDGGYVVPPFGEAHTHRLSHPDNIAEDAAAFISDGVFYAMVQDPTVELTDQHHRLSRAPNLPDVSYTQGVVTPSWGVVADFYGMMVQMGRYGDGASVDNLDGKVLFRIDTKEDLEAAWPEITSLNDRFIKAIIAFSDAVEKRVANPSTYGANPPHSSSKPGLRPEVFKQLVRRAHADGLEVSAHIETTADLRLAVEAGVDWIAHMPASWQVGEGTGYESGVYEPWLLDMNDAYAARRAGINIMTTLIPWFEDDPRADSFEAIHRHNLGVLAEAGAALTIGSDYSSGTSVDEALYLRTLDILSDAQLFRLLAVQTPRAIFPELRIGHLRNGWEATFLVLDGDPTQDLGHIRNIRYKVKRGHILE